MITQIKQFTEICGERLVLQPITAGDYAVYASLYGDDNILRYIAPALDDDKLLSSFQVAVKLSQQNPCSRSFLVVKVKESGQAAGILGITVTDAKTQIEVGVIFRPEFQKQHLAFEALQVLITFLCNQYVNYSVIADVNLDNKAAVWLAKRLGFEYKQQTKLFELDKQNRPKWGN